MGDKLHSPSFNTSLILMSDSSLWRLTSSLEGSAVDCYSAWRSVVAGTCRWPWRLCLGRSVWHRTRGCAPRLSDREPWRADGRKTWWMQTTDFLTKTQWLRLNSRVATNVGRVCRHLRSRLPWFVGASWRSWQNPKNIGCARVREGYPRIHSAVSKLNRKKQDGWTL